MNEKIIIFLLLLILVSRSDRFIKIPHWEIKFKKIFGTNILIHWSVFPAMLIIGMSLSKDIKYQIFAAFLMVLLIVLHEIGHAWLVIKRGYKLNFIELRDFHGVCNYSFLQNKSLHLDQAIISWGGVILQLIVALPLVIFSQLGVIPEIPFVSIFVIVFGYISLFLVVINLIPVQPLDGATAWGVLRHISFKRANPESVQNKTAKNSKITRIK